MYFAQPFRVLFFSFLLCFTFTEPLRAQGSMQQYPQDTLHPRFMEELLHDRWHIIVDTLSCYSIVPPRFAFWGFRLFLHTLTLKMAQEFPTSPPSPHYSFSMGSLLLSADSTTGDPIAWETMNFLLDRLSRWVQNGWRGGEIALWLTDEWSDTTVHIELRALLDAPMH